MPRWVRYLSAEHCRDWVLRDASLHEAPLEGDSRSLVVVVDYAEESYVPTSLPMLRGADQRRLCARRLEREFPGALLTALVRLRARSAEGSIDAVMMAVGGGAPLATALRELGTRQALRAVYTPALLAASWVRLAGLSERRVLTVMPTPAGVRLTFVDAGHAVLSRLTGPLATGATAAEIARTVQYLQNTQRVERGVPLELWFWGVPEQDVAQYVPGGDQTRLGSAPPTNGLPDPQRQGFAALLALAASRPSGPQLASDALRAGWIARRLQRTARWAAAAVVLFAGCLAGWLSYEAAVAARSAQAFAAEREGYERERAALEDELARQGLALVEWQVLPEVASRLQEGALDLADALEAAGGAFGAVADLQVMAIELRAGEPTAGSDTAQLTPVADALAAPDAPSAPPEAECLQQATVAATMKIDFTLAPRIGVRRRESALGFVREAAMRLGPWQPGTALLRLGAADPLVVNAGDDASEDATTWSACLRRGGAA
jgi:hypothetical protein